MCVSVHSVVLKAGFLVLSDLRKHSSLRYTYFCLRITSAPGSEGARNDDRKKQKKKKRDKNITKDKSNKKKGKELPLPPPPTTDHTTYTNFTGAADFIASEGREAWHLCHDEDGNAYYYNETSGD